VCSFQRFIGIYFLKSFNRKEHKVYSKGTKDYQSLFFSSSPIHPFTPSSLTPDASRLMPRYSYLRASTGFLVAALQLCQLTVNIAIDRAIIPASEKTHQLKSVL
jgi:hypothetical protein